MACKKVTVRSHKRCFCNGKLAKHSRCGVKALGAKRGTKKSRKSTMNPKKACKPGTVGKYGVTNKCGCKTVGGGFKPVDAWRCK